MNHILVLPDRDAAEELAEEATERFTLPRLPQLVRDALAGEDDAEDAQWLVVIEYDDEDATELELEAAALLALAEEYGGWVEED
ncbi:hypothetical protein [Streptomyces sp. NBC_01262]|uniref:hypothetical protein n=1 Tax=Streptomyces sp. NBC_01262 TaxID=2903803 RepID=UPI002E33C192|nr:hypothetical protein [Streptomyces sp. NBC_01262]